IRNRASTAAHEELVQYRIVGVHGDCPLRQQLKRLVAKIDRKVSVYSRRYPPFDCWVHCLPPVKACRILDEVENTAPIPNRRRESGGHLAREQGLQKLPRLFKLPSARLLRRRHGRNRACHWSFLP